MQKDTDAVIQELLKSLRKAAKGKGIIYNKTKTKDTQIIYDEALKKPIREIVTETEALEPKSGNFDISTLKTVSGILKELKELQLSSSNNNHQGGVVILAGEDTPAADE